MSAHPEAPMNTEDAELVEVVANAMQNAELNDGDEGNTYRLFDLLDFSGENKAVMITRQLARAAITASGITRVEEENVRLREALQKCAEPHRWHAPCVRCGPKMVEQGCYIARDALAQDR